MNAENKADFQKAMTKISVNGENTAAYLEKIEHSRWALYAMSESGAITYGRKTSNAAEQSNSATGCIGKGKARFMQPLKAIEQMLHNINDAIVQIQTDINKRGHQFSVLTPYCSKIYRDTLAEKNSHAYKVSVASAGLKATVEYPVLHRKTRNFVHSKQCLVDLSGEAPYGSCYMA